MNTRLEIFINGKWKFLELWDRKSIKYNKVVNKISNTNTREISHSNTLSIPPNHHNITTLKINIFNQKDLATALNTKYVAKYYIEEKLVQEGFIVINRASSEDIKINFIDNSLGIIDIWGSTKFRDLLNSPQLDIPNDYKDAINEMKNYILPTDSVANILSEVGSRGHNLSLFPNNLNTIGDDYMVDKEGDRPNDSINPYQSRPIFNCKSLFDLASTAYGYTPIYDNSVNWEKVEKTYFVPSGLSDNFVDEGISSTFSTIVFNNNLILLDSTLDRVAVVCPSSRSEKPINIIGWVDPEPMWLQNYLNENVIFKPDLNSQPNGIIKYKVNYSNLSTTTVNNTYGVWVNDTNTGVNFKSLFIDNALDSNNILTYEIGKVQLFNPPPNSGDFIGIISTIETSGTIFNFQITESFLAIESVSYDERKQFQNQPIDLTFAAPDETIKELLVGIMSTIGILMSINTNKKEILFYNYSRYLNKRNDGEFTDLSEYLLEYEPFGYNTDFGNNFGKLNEIGLKKPFKGNTFFVSIENNLSDSKLKDFSKNLSKKFGDVTKVNRIPNTNTPYIEYENKGLGLVTHNGTLGPLEQIKFYEDPQNNDPTFFSQGSITGIPSLENFSYTFLPLGISEWYRMVNTSIKARPYFLLPSDLVRNIDISLPVYIEQMGGFYIIEEISEYENPQKKVMVKVIKLIDGAEFSDDFSDDFDI